MNNTRAPKPSKRTVPANIDIEADVIGTTLIDPEMLDTVYMKITPADFYWEQHKTIWRVVLDLLNAGRQPNEPTVRDEVIARGWQERIQGRDASGVMLGDCGYLTHLTNIAYPPVFEQSVTKLLELSRCRKGIDVCWRTITDLQTGDIGSAGVLGRAIQGLGDILEGTASAQDADPLAELAKAEATRLLEESQTPDTLSGVPTGFTWLDSAMRGGFQSDDLVTIGARTNTGKSKISLYMLASAAAAGVTCGIISLDMGRARLLPYIIPAFNNTFRPTQRITTSQLYSPEEAGELRDARIWDVCSAIDPERKCFVISDPRTFSVESIAGYVRILAQKGCKLILLDQVQNIGGWERGAVNRGEYHGIYNELKMLPRRHHLTLVVLHQVNREGADRPQLRNLQDSGVVEQFSDFVILLHDYQSSLISTHGGFVLQGDRARPPKAGDSNTMICKPVARRLISVHLAKSRSSAAERKDVYFDYSHGIAV